MSERQTKKKLWKPPTRKSQDTLGSFRRRAFWLEDTTQPSLGAFFSFDEEWLERSATCWEIGDKFYAQECREQAKFIARLRDLEDNLAGEIVETFTREEQRVFPAIFFLSHGSKTALRALNHKTLKYCEHMAMLAEQSEAEAVQTLARIAILATQTVNRIAMVDAAALGTVARDEVAWPVMKSPQPKFSDDEKTLWGKLEVGSTFFNMTARARVEADKGFGRVAWKLWKYVHQLRGQVQTFCAENPKGLAGVDKGSVVKLASDLPDFGHDSMVVNQWWKLALRCLIEAYPHPTKAGELNEQVPALNRLVRAPSHRKT